jgi:hypothetical protein
MRAWSLDALVQLKCMEDIYGGSFSQGRTMRSGHSTVVLEFIGQKVHKENGDTRVIEARFPWLAPLTASVYGAQHALLGSKERPHF